MARKYICDNCGKETEHADDMRQLQTVTVEFPFEAEDVCELCQECMEKLGKIIEEGFQ